MSRRWCVFVWWVGPCGFAMSHFGWFISFLATGMAGGLDGRWICYVTAPEGGWPSSGGKRRLIRGGGLVTRISNIDEPQIPVVSDDIPCPSARDVVVSRVGVARPLETVAPLGGAVLNDARQPYSDSEASDDDVLSVSFSRRAEKAVWWAAFGMKIMCSSCDQLWHWSSNCACSVASVNRTIWMTRSWQWMLNTARCLGSYTKQYSLCGIYI